jgi:putative transposase
MPGPAGGAIDGQSVKTMQGGGAGGFDAGRRIEGRKRHALTAAPGRPVGPVVHRAGVPDRDGAPELPRSVRARWPWLRTPVADGAWDRGKLVEKAAVPDFTVEAGRRIGEEPVFEVLPGAGWSSAPSPGRPGGAASCGSTRPASTSPRP